MYMQSGIMGYVPFWIKDLERTELFILEQTDLFLYFAYWSIQFKSYIHEWLFKKN